MLAAVSRRLEDEIAKLVRMQDRLGFFMNAWPHRSGVAGTFTEQLAELEAVERELRAALERIETASK